MTGEESKEVIRRYTEALSSGDIALAQSMFAPDARIWLAAGPPFWGEQITVDQYFGMVVGFADIIDESADYSGARIIGMIAEGNKVAVQMESRVPLKQGKVYNNHYHLYYEVADGRIVVLNEYHDTLHFVECASGGNGHLLGQPQRRPPLEPSP